MMALRIVYLADASSIHTRRWAAHFAQRGYEVHVVSFLPGDIPGATVHVLDGGPVRSEGGNWRYLLHLPALRRLLRSVRPDLVHAHYLTSYGLLGALSGFRPLVLTAWGSDVLVTPHRSRLYRPLLRLTLARADLVTSDAAAMSNEMIRLGLPAERLLTVPLGVDLTLFNPADRDWPADGRRLISTRQLLPNTNLDTLLAALALARREHPGLTLDIIGDGPERGRWGELARQLGVEGYLRWHGGLDHGLLPAHLRQADLYLALTLSDSTSVSLLEAMACGTFPIVSDLPANREWITPGMNGLLVPPTEAAAAAEAILSAAANPTLRRRAAEQNAALIAGRADWQKNMEQVEAAYRALIQRKQAP